MSDPAPESGVSGVARLATRSAWALVAVAILVPDRLPVDPGRQLHHRHRALGGPVRDGVADRLRPAARLRLRRRAGGRGRRGGLLAEAVGLHTGYPFGRYNYSGTLGPALFGVPLVVPLAWTMMAWPALVVGRTLATRPVPVVLTAAAVLTAWDVFLDAQMVAAGHWSWATPEPGLPFVGGVPPTNYGGWLVVSVVIASGLHLTLHGPPGQRCARSGPAAVLYLWTYGSSIIAHLAFFDLPGSALMGGLLMGAVALPYGRALATPRSPRPGAAPGPARSSQPSTGHRTGVRHATSGPVAGPVPTRSPA